MEDPADAWSVEILHKLGLNLDSVRDHVFRPDHVATARLRAELFEAGDGDRPADAPPPSGRFHRLNVDGLGRDLHDLLSRCLTGYSLQLRRYGRTILDLQWQSAKMPVDGGLAWTPDVPMHVASVSKLITAMALTKLLHSRNISPDAHILPWLPKYWQKGPGVAGLTFRHLLTHTSGLVLLDEPGPSDFQFMKDQIALGTVGQPGYRNMNYGLCRILISTIDAPFLFDLIPGASDAYWDLTTIRYYARYVSENIFAPVGVTSTLVHTEDHALAYPFPPFLPFHLAVPGWSSGDLSTMSGCVAWHLSVDDLLRVMAGFRRGGVIVDPARAQTMLDRQFGLDVKRDTPLGRIYAKGGFWSTDGGKFVEQSNAFFLPKGMEMVILANSPLCRPDRAFLGDVLDAIERNIESTLFTFGLAAASAVALAGLFGPKRSRRRR
jgi:CubicO group peptidase (beta-lactamase class C family)